jgi:DNA-binding PadR family transcriptional regulator
MSISSADVIKSYRALGKIELQILHWFSLRPTTTLRLINPFKQTNPVYPYLDTLFEEDLLVITKEYSRGTISEHYLYSLTSKGKDVLKRYIALRDPYQSKEKREADLYKTIYKKDQSL